MLTVPGLGCYSPPVLRPQGEDCRVRLGVSRLDTDTEEAVLPDAPAIGSAAVPRRARPGGQMAAVRHQGWYPALVSLLVTSSQLLTISAQRDDIPEELIRRTAETLASVPTSRPWRERIVLGCWDVCFTVPSPFSFLSSFSLSFPLLSPPGDYLVRSDAYLGQIHPPLPGTPAWLRYCLHRLVAAVRGPAPPVRRHPLQPAAARARGAVGHPLRRTRAGPPAQGVRVDRQRRGVDAVEPPQGRRRRHHRRPGPLPRRVPPAPAEWWERRQRRHGGEEKNRETTAEERFLAVDAPVLRSDRVAGAGFCGYHPV